MLFLALLTADVNKWLHSTLKSTLFLLFLGWWVSGGVTSLVVFQSLVDRECNTNHIIKFADDTTVVLLIRDDDDAAYREDMERLSHMLSQDKTLCLNVDKPKKADF